MLGFFFQSEKLIYKRYFSCFFGKQSIITVLPTTSGTRPLCSKPSPFFLAERPWTSHLTSLSHESGPRSWPHDKTLLSCFSRVRLCATPQTAAHQAPCPWDSPGKNTGVGCHFLLQCMKVKSQSEVAQSCLTLSDPMDCSPPGSLVHGIFQARVLEWGARHQRCSM